MVLDSSLCSVRVVVGVKVVALQAEIELTLNRASISNAKSIFYTSTVMFNLSESEVWLWFLTQGF